MQNSVCPFRDSQSELLVTALFAGKGQCKSLGKRTTYITDWGRDLEDGSSKGNRRNVLKFLERIGL